MNKKIHGTCQEIQPKGWGSGCGLLILKDDHLYHCEDCGLVYEKPDPLQEKREIESNVSGNCQCPLLMEEVKWSFDEMFGYDCPRSQYCCMICDTHYKIPSFATLEKQESGQAKDYVQQHIIHKQQEQDQKLSRIKEDVNRLVEALKKIPPEKRQELVQPLFF
jgi:hypothetical protein